MYKTNDNAYIFITTDPLGRKITLKSTTWDYHIINRRPELIGQENVIKSIIEDPKFILPDPEENRERYYDIVHLTSMGKIKPVMVVVEHINETGDICTAMVKSTMKDTTERGIIYERPKRTY
jgi:hypothetical protein